MWNFLRPGQRGVDAVATLEELLRELGKIESNLPSDQVVAANSYLKWTELAEHRLLSVFQGFTVLGRLHSGRYWRIRSMDALTSRPMPLIKAEIAVQKTYLRDSLAQLSQHLTLLSLPSDHWIVILDTNVYIHGQLFHEVDWHRQVSAKRATVVMPLAILDELDKVKDSDPTFGKRAQSVLRALDQLTEANGWLTPIPIRQNVWLQLLDEVAGHQRRLRQDDEIVRQATYFSQLNENRLVLFTRDRGMRLRAQVSGLTSRALPQELERIRTKDE